MVSPKYHKKFSKVFIFIEISNKCGKKRKKLGESKEVGNIRSNDVETYFFSFPRVNNMVQQTSDKQVLVFVCVCDKNIFSYLSSSSFQSLHISVAFKCLTVFISHINRSLVRKNLNLTGQLTGLVSGLNKNFDYFNIFLE